VAVSDPAPETRELGPIRPPSEAYSLLIRVTRNCPWNRCKFCPIYKEARFGLRTVAEVKGDIDAARATHDEITALAENSGGDIRQAAATYAASAPSDAARNVALWLYAGGENAFLQDANTLVMKTPQLVEIIEYLRETFPGIRRITSYARSQTAARKTLAELKELAAAGLSRLHIGLESGYDPVLAFMNKGVTAAEHITGGKNVVASGISLCEYFMPGAGGQKWWREHAAATARVLNEINPDFIRLRTLVIQPRMLLHQDVVSGEFVRASDEAIVAEIRLFLENLEVTSRVVSDHMTNLLPEIEGQLPGDKARLLGVIARFQGMSQPERDNYKLGRRLGVYNELDDMKDTYHHAAVAAALERLEAAGNDLDEVLWKLMERFV
jgi:hypothetical protein